MRLLGRATTVCAAKKPRSRTKGEHLVGATILENGSEGAGVQGSRVPGNIDAGRVFLAMPKRVWMDLAINSLLPNRDDQRFHVQTVGGRRPVTCICRQPVAYRRSSRVQATITKGTASCVLPNNMQPKTRPIQRLATAVSRCSVEVSMPKTNPSPPDSIAAHGSRRQITLMPTLQAALYGKCVVADYNSVHKDQCAKEFMKLKNCYLVRHPYSSLHIVFIIRPLY
jgi:NADH dehydrogenase [ubiquinone] 1 alpha subcomplex assembly factor 8